MSVYIMYTYVHTLYTLYKEDNMNTCTFIQSSRPVTLDMHSVAEGTDCARKVHTDGRHSMRRSEPCTKHLGQPHLILELSLETDIRVKTFCKEPHNLETGS